MGESYPIWNTVEKSVVGNHLISGYATYQGLALGRTITNGLN